MTRDHSPSGTDTTVTRKRQRGTALVTALVVSTLAFLVVSLVAAWASAQSMVTSSLEAHQRAKALAEASIHRALAAAWAAPDFAALPSASWEIQDGLASGSISFDKAWAGVHKIPLSTSNLAGMTSVPGSLGQAVPPHSIQLIGVGRCGQTTVQVKAVVYQGGYPYAIASQGPVQAHSGLLVGSLDSSAELAAGDLVTNSAGLDAVRLGPDCLVTGDVRASGGIILDAQATVKGQTLPNSSSVDIPKVPLKDFLPLNPAVLGSTLSGQTLVGPCLSNQGLSIYGDLQLDGATLYVKGDLNVQGSIRGRGLVVSEGTTTISGGADMGSSDQAVLVTGGDLVLQGAGHSVSRFQGLVYTEGSFRAQNISLVGVFISRGASGTVLDSVQLTPRSEYTHLNLADEQEQIFTFAGAQTSNEDFYLDFAIPAGLFSKLAAKVNVSSQAPRISKVDISVVLANTSQGQVYRISDPYSGQIVVATSSQEALQVMQGLAENYFQIVYPGQTVSVTGQLQNLVNNLQSRTLLQSLNAMSLAGIGTTQATAGAKFDLSQFLSPETTMRIVSWRVQ